MPACDVGDFSDVVDAINKLCDTMKTSQYECDDTETESANGSVVTFSASDGTVECAGASVEDLNVSVSTVQTVEACSLETMSGEDVSIYYEAVSASTHLERTSARDDSLEDRRSGMSIGEEVALLSNEPFTHEVPHRLLEAMYADVISPETSYGGVEVFNGRQNWSDSTVSLPVETVTSDVAYEPASEMYYTASSEVSLLSDTEIPLADRGAADEESLNGKEGNEERKDCVIAGHVAAMRERFESMTRTNTPCPDLVRSMSPTLDVFRNITPSPDRLG